MLSVEELYNADNVLAKEPPADGSDGNERKSLNAGEKCRAYEQIIWSAECKDKGGQASQSCALAIQLLSKHFVRFETLASKSIVGHILDIFESLAILSSFTWGSRSR